MFPASFGYVAPRSVEEALELMAKHGEDGKLLAGGHSLIPAMKLRLQSPRTLIDLGTVPGLQGIKAEGGQLIIGALTVHADVATSDLVRKHMPGLADAASVIGDVQVRNRGTIGGSVAHADPAADLPVILTALNASLRRAIALRHPHHRRGRFLYRLLHHGVERQRDPYGNSCTDSICGNRHGLRQTAASRIGLRRRQRGRADHPTSFRLLLAARIAIGGLGSGPLRAIATEIELQGKPLTTQIIAAAAAKAAEETDPVEDSTPARNTNDTWRPCTRARPSKRQWKERKAKTVLVIVTRVRNTVWLIIPIHEHEPRTRSRFKRLFMTTEHTPNGLIGASPKRVEDPPLITGKGCYVDDINLPGMLHLAFQRSPYPHAKIISIDTSKAKAMPGVEAVITGNDLSEKLNLAPSQVLPNMKIPPHPVLARGAVHCAGVPVAAVVARTRAQAEDAANAIEVEYEALPGVSNAEEALKPGAPLAHEELDSNICYTMTKNGGDVDKAFAEADHVFTMHIASPRQVALAMEPRGIVASPDPFGKNLTVWLSTQGPHRARAEIANTLGFPENKIHLDRARRRRRLRQQRTALPRRHRRLLSRAQAAQAGQMDRHAQRRFHHDDPRPRPGDDLRNGAQKRRQDARPESQSRRQSRRLSALQHRRPAAAHDGHGLRQLSDSKTAMSRSSRVFTNTCPTGPYRGAGRPESVLNIERLLDKAAAVLGMDRLEIRRKNFIQPDQFPYTTGTGVEYDSGDYRKVAARSAQALQLRRSAAPAR